MPGVSLGRATHPAYSNRQGVAATWSVLHRVRPLRVFKQPIVRLGHRVGSMGLSNVSLPRRKRLASDNPVYQHRRPDPWSVDDPALLGALGGALRGARL